MPLNAIMIVAEAPVSEMGGKINYRREADFCVTMQT